MMALGLVAVAEPLVATLAVEKFVGWPLLLGGIVGVVGAFAGFRIRGFRWLLISALLAVAIGAYLISQPLGGIPSLMLAAALFFGAQGIAQFIIAIGHRAVFVSWLWIFLSSIVNFCLAGIILSGTAGTAMWTLGLMFGINLVMWGLALAATALACRAYPEVLPASKAAI